GLPFAFVLFLMMVGMFKALRVEGIKAESERGSLAGFLPGRSTTAGVGPRDWGQRLARAMSFPTRAEVLRYLGRVVRPAMEEISHALADKGFAVQIVEGEAGKEHLELNV